MQLFRNNRRRTGRIMFGNRNQRDRWQRSERTTQARGFYYAPCPGRRLWTSVTQLNWAHVVVRISFLAALGWCRCFRQNWDFDEWAFGFGQGLLRVARLRFCSSLRTESAKSVFRQIPVLILAGGESARVFALWVLFPSFRSAILYFGPNLTLNTQRATEGGTHVSTSTAFNIVFVSGLASQ